MILVRAKYKGTSEELLCPYCNTRFIIVNLSSHSGKTKCPYCGEYYQLDIKVEISVAKIEKPARAKKEESTANTYAATYGSTITTDFEATPTGLNALLEAMHRDALVEGDRPVVHEEPQEPPVTIRVPRRRATNNG